MAESESPVVLEEQLRKIKKWELRVYLRIGLVFLLGLGLLLFVFNDEGKIPGGLGLFGLLIMVVSLFVLSFYTDIFYRIKGSLKSDISGEEFKETWVNWPDWYVKWGRTALIFVAGAVLMLVGSLHENDFGGKTFVWHSIAAGVLVGLLLFHVGKLLKPSWGANRNLSGEIIIYFILGFVYLFVVFGPLVNSSFATQPAVCRAAEVEDYDGGKYMHVRIEGRRERFRPHTGISEKLAGKKTVLLCVRKGFLGYDYVHEFRVVE